MKTTKKIKNLLSFTVCTVLIAAIALLTMGCGDTKKEIESPDTGTDAEAGKDSTENTGVGSGTGLEQSVLGEGKTKFYFTVVDPDGKETSFEINTDKTVVGEALVEVGLISGEEGPYGIYVKTVNGITLDYDRDGKYWAFYENGKYGIAGADKTAVTAGASYAFKAEK